MNGQQDDQGSNKGASSNPPAGDSSEQPAIGDESQPGKSEADRASGSGPRRGSLANPSNPYDEAKAFGRKLGGEPDSKGG